jgi:hypothetical protein
MQVKEEEEYPVVELNRVEWREGLSSSVEKWKEITRLRIEMASH